MVINHIHYEYQVQRSKLLVGDFSPLHSYGTNANVNFCEDCVSIWMEWYFTSVAAIWLLYALLL